MNRTIAKHGGDRTTLITVGVDLTARLFTPIDS